MKDLSKLSNQELSEIYDSIHEAWNQDLNMDGSGECGGFIAEHYTPILEPISEEMSKRNMFDEGQDSEMDDYLPY